MTGISRTCLGCQAEIRPEERFCPRCGRWTGNGTAVPGTAAGGLVPGDPPPAPPGGPGATVVLPPGPLPPQEAPGAAAATDWSAPTVPNPAYPAPPGQAPVPRAELPPAPLPPAPLPPAQQPPAQFPPTRSYPPPSYDPPPYGGQPYGGQPPGGQPPGGQEFTPFRPYPPPLPPGPPRQPPRRHDRNRSGFPALFVVLPVAAACVAVAVVLLVVHPFGRPAPHDTAGPGASAGGSPAGTPSARPGSGSPSAATVTERQAAAGVGTLLARSVTDRTSINNAYKDVMACGPNLTSDVTVFSDAASSRAALLTSLAAVPGRATLPPAVLSDLATAWQASVTADRALARWANDEITKGCVRNDTSDPGYRATMAPDSDATKYKTAFAAAWNPVAARYGLTQYQQEQL